MLIFSWQTLSTLQGGISCTQKFLPYLQGNCTIIRSAGMGAGKEQPTWRCSANRVCETATSAWKAVTPRNMARRAAAATAASPSNPAAAAMQTRAPSGNFARADSTAGNCWANVMWLLQLTPSLLCTPKLLAASSCSLNTPSHHYTLARNYQPLRNLQAEHAPKN